MIVAITSDRGLCGAVHTNVAKVVRSDLKLDSPEAAQTKVFCVGDKSRALLQRYLVTLQINTLPSSRCRFGTQQERISFVYNVSVSFCREKIT